MVRRQQQQGTPAKNVPEIEATSANDAAMIEAAQTGDAPKIKDDSPVAAATEATEAGDATVAR